jgi:hypothetical protein
MKISVLRMARLGHRCRHGSTIPDANASAITRLELRMVVSDFGPPHTRRISRRRWADYDFCNSSGSLAILAAIFRASSLLSNLSAEPDF